MRVLFVFLFSFTTQVVFGQTLTPLITDTDYVYRSLSVALQDPDHVYKLDLSRHKLKAIPDDVFKFKNLRELNLSHNKIKIIPADIAQLNQLQRLNLANNDLDSLPDAIGNLTQLVYLGLNRNEITALPDSIGNLKDLEVLELWDNELSIIPDGLSKLKNLQTLELRGILFSEEEQARIRSLVPNATIFFSPSCLCKF